MSATSEIAEHGDRDSPTEPGFPILVIDDHELFSTSLTMALRSKGFDTEALTVAFALDLAHQHRCDPVGLVVLDLDLGQDTDGRWVSGVDLVADLRRQGWKVLIVSGSVDKPGVAAAIAAGAIGSLPKSQPFEELLDAVTMAARGQPLMTEAEHRSWLERHRRYQARERELTRRLARLSPREREVLELLADGMRAAAIAEHFVVSMPTVRTQIRSILAKLDVRSQLEAVALFRQQPDPADRGRAGRA